MATLFGREWTRVDLQQQIGSMEQLAGIRVGTITDGPGAGMRIFHVYTAPGLNFDVLADKALDISRAEFRGIPLTWQSPAGDVHPARYEPDGLGWLRAFQGGLLTTCGLDHFGPPCEDQGRRYGLHGRVANLPAEQVGCSCDWVGDEYRLQITGKVRQASLYGENLLLERAITVWMGRSEIQIDDRVTNLGDQPQPHMILYHCNFGFPLIGPTTRLRLDCQETIPRTPEAARGLGEWDRFQAPDPRYSEQVFCHRPRPQADNRGRAELYNPTLGLTTRLEFDLAGLPWLYEWKMMGVGAYVVGLEPANTATLEGIAEARRLGVLPELAPGEARRYRLKFTLEAA
jgi:hypothetical protein